MAYYIAVWRKYAMFSGRARRREYWYFTLFNAIVILPLELSLLGAAQGAHNDSLTLFLVLLLSLYSLAMFIPSLAVSVRRMHDIDKSGWWILIGCVPIIGSVWWLILTCTDGTQGVNKYGPDPKAEDAIGLSV